MVASRHPQRVASRQLPLGQWRALRAVVTGPGDTYAQIAVRMGVSVNTLKTHLLRMRRARPDLYAQLMTMRSRALVERHREALERAELHSRMWHRKQFFRAYGFWPKERRRRSTSAQQTKGTVRQPTPT